MEEVCTACLCGDRNLYDLRNTTYLNFYYQMLTEINSTTVIEECKVPKRFCWECCALFRHLHRFRDTVRRAQSLLSQFSLKELYHKSLGTPRLHIHKALHLSYPDHDKENGTDFDLEIKQELEDSETHEEPDTFVDRLSIDNSLACKEEKGKVEYKRDEVVIKGVNREKKDFKKSRKKKDKVKSKVKKKFKLSTSRQLPLSNGLSDSDTPLSNYEDLAVKSEELGIPKVELKRDGPTDQDYPTAPSNEIKFNVAENYSESENYRIDRSESTNGQENKVLNTKSSSVNKKHRDRIRVQRNTPHQKEERPQCVECGKSFSSRKTYRYHMNVLHKGQNNYPCSRCGKVYQWKSNLGRHMRTHRARDAGELYCEPCDRRFSSVATYRQHLRISRRHVAEDDFTFMCNECGKRFVNKVRLRDHIDWEHLNNIKFSCDLCLKAFKCHTSLYVHTQNVHRNREKKDNLCHVCGKSYQNAAKLRYHIVAMHSGETPYSCGQCRAAFGWYSSLYRHVREVHHKMKVQTNKSKAKKNQKGTEVLADENYVAPV